MYAKTILRHVWRGGADAEDPARQAALAATLAPRVDPGERRDQAALAATRPTRRSRAASSACQPWAIGEKLFWGFDALDMAAALLRGDPWFVCAALAARGRAALGSEAVLKRR